MNSILRAGAVLVITAGFAGSAIAQEVLEFSFSAQQTPAQIPNSDGATICALTFVDDDVDAGQCQVFYDGRNARWMYGTGSNQGGHSCATTCVWVEGSNDRRLARRVRGLEREVEILRDVIERRVLRSR